MQLASKHKRQYANMQRLFGVFEFKAAETLEGGATIYLEWRGSEEVEIMGEEKKHKPIDKKIKTHRRGATRR